MQIREVLSKEIKMALKKHCSLEATLKRKRVEGIAIKRGENTVYSLASALYPAEREIVETALDTDTFTIYDRMLVVAA